MVSLGLKGLGVAAAAPVVVTVLHLVRSGAVNRNALLVGGIALVGLGPLGLGFLAVVPPLAIVAVWLEESARPADSYSLASNA